MLRIVDNEIMLLTEPYCLFVFNLVAGLIFGHVFFRADFCMGGMFRDLFLLRKSDMMRSLFLLLVLSMVLFYLAKLSGLLRLFPPPSFLSLPSLEGWCSAQGWYWLAAALWGLFTRWWRETLAVSSPLAASSREAFSMPKFIPSGTADVAGSLVCRYIGKVADKHFLKAGYHIRRNPQNSIL